MFWGISLWVYRVWDSLYFLDLGDYFLPHFREVFNDYLKYFLSFCLLLLYPARISFKYEGEIKSFTNNQKLREFSTTKPALQQMLKDLL